MEDAKRDLKGIDFIKYDDVRIHNMRKMNLQRDDKIADRPGAQVTTATCTGRIQSPSCKEFAGDPANLAR